MVLHSLREAVHLNGARGVIARAAPGGGGAATAGLVCVALDAGGAALVRPCNLASLPTVPPPGSPPDAPPGGLIAMESPIAVSRVALLDPADG